jgi:hypothetical protein
VSSPDPHGLQGRDRAMVVNKVVAPNMNGQGGFAFTWDHRFQALQVMARCGQLAHGLQVGTFKMQPLLKQMDVRAEELRALASELEAEQNIEDLTMPDLCRRAIDTVDLRGKDVLDIGGYNGEMAAYCLERGAKRAVVLDNNQWEHYGWERPVMPAGVDYIQRDFRELISEYAVVLFFNVIYHLEDPHAALRHLRMITGETMLLCTMYVYSDLPVWRVYEPREVNPTDETVYWGPSPTGLAKSLKVTGWSSVEEIGRSVERMVVRCRP